MWALSTFFLAAVFSCGSAQDLQQTPISITKPEGKTVLINCHVSSPVFSNVFIHWYQKRANEAPKRVGYISSRTFLENQLDEGKFTIEKDLSKSVCTLTVSKITLQDSATYYCGLICAGSMLLLPVLLASSFWSRGDMQSVPVQTPEVHHQMKGRSASMSCRLTAKAIVHWYKHLPGEPLRRILYLSGHAPAFDDSNDRNRFEVREDPTQPLYDLTINSLTPRDSGTYYCAYWVEPHGVS